MDVQNKLIDPENILGSDFIDLLFKHKNKEYGAYELRKQYNKRLTTALILTCAILLFIGACSIAYNQISAAIKSRKKAVVVADVKLEDVRKEEEKKAPPPPPPPPKPPEPKVEMKKFTPPKIVKDEDVKPDEKPPEMAELEKTRIGTKTQEGVKDEGIVEAPSDEGVGDAPVVESEEPVTKVEIEAGFPGGDKAWARYVEREITKHIDALQDAGFSGTVIVQFVVDKDGNVSRVEALTNPATKLAEIAVNAIKNGPKWTPAVQNGKYVKAYRKQPVTFKLEDE